MFQDSAPVRTHLPRYAWLSIAAAIVTIVLKAVAFFVTGSVGLLSDALESFVNLAGALMALAMLTIAARPADEEHAYGHSKAEYFSSGFEGALILIAAASIAVAAFQRLMSPRGLEQVGLGLGVSVVASLVNLGVALVLRKAARRHGSVTLEANAQHLLTDVWTSAGVLVGVVAVVLTGWKRLDPLVALFVAGNILVTGFQIVRTSIQGLMDAALPPEERQAIRTVLERYRGLGIEYHEVLTRRAGARRFVSMHVLVPGEWTVDRGHRLMEQIEDDVRAAVPNVAVLTHLESLEDPRSWDGTDKPAGETGRGDGTDTRAAEPARGARK